MGCKLHIGITLANLHHRHQNENNKNDLDCVDRLWRKIKWRDFMIDWWYRPVINIIHSPVNEVKTARKYSSPRRFFFIPEEAT